VICEAWTVRPPVVSRRTAVIALVAYCCFLAVVLLAPSSSDQSRAAGVLVDLGRQVGRGAHATQARAEFIANVLILMPVSALGSLVWPQTRWRDWTAWGFVLAGCVELAQGIALSARTASFTDVVANTLGATGGALVVALLRKLEVLRERR
jgi:hypothetical protein